MSIFILYVKNLAIAFARMVKAFFLLYRYHPDDAWFYNVMVVFDCLCNTIAFGDPDETISSRCAKAMVYEQGKGEWGGGCRMCSFLAAFQKDHCALSLERNKGHRAIIKDES